MVVVGVNGGCLYTTKIAKNKKKMKPRKKLFAFPLFESINFHNGNRDLLSSVLSINMYDTQNSQKMS